MPRMLRRPARSSPRTRPPVVKAALLALGLATACIAGEAQAGPVMLTMPVSSVLNGQGQGLCVINAVSMSPATDFPQGAGVFNSGINTFLQGQKANWVQYVQQTIFDLSNNQDTGPKISWGDFVNSMSPACPEGGCPFFMNDTTTAFASRFRGFLNVTSTLAGQVVHIGFYADDAVSLTFFDKTGQAFPILTQPPVLGAPTWRMTEGVTFTQPGLYPLEILYVQIVEHAALEMTFFIGDPPPPFPGTPFADFQSPANQAPVVPLGNPAAEADAGLVADGGAPGEGFTLFNSTDFFQTLSGAPSYPNVTQCKQCDRQFVGQTGNNGCDAGYYCNEAALCAPCDTAIFCGPTCSPCGGATPFCINTNGQAKCGQCRTNSDCPAGFACDPTTHTCDQCNTDADCKDGRQTCVAHACTWCSTASRCAGNSCNCCPLGANGKQMQCLVLGTTTSCQKDVDCAPGTCDIQPGQTKGVCIAPAGATTCKQDSDCGVGGTCNPSNNHCENLPECVECTKDADCTEGGVCDVLIGQCVASHAPHESGQCCGDGCLKCDPANPLCLPGPFGTACAACRNDLECPSGNYCREGQCFACTVDQRCGPRCARCSGDTPFCASDQVAAGATCVRCTSDDQCAGGKCDTSSHTCSATCPMTCAAGTFCDGQSCVECYADTQCACSGTCDTTAHKCSTSCQTNVNCLGDQHCQHADDGTGSKFCSPGPLPDNASCGSTLANLCSGNSIGSRGTSPVPPAGVAALSILALLLRRRRRRSP